MEIEIKLDVAGKQRVTRIIRSIKKSIKTHLRRK